MLKVKRYMYMSPSKDDPKIPLVTIKTEDEIIDSFYSEWCDKMIGAGHGNKLTRENCIDDWCIIHLAQEIILDN